VSLAAIDAPRIGLAIFVPAPGCDETLLALARALA
jgi:hypothetical protein